MSGELFFCLLDTFGICVMSNLIFTSRAIGDEVLDLGSATATIYLGMNYLFHVGRAGV